MNALSLIAVVLVCVTLLAFHALKLHHQRCLRAELVKERTEDAAREKRLTELAARAEVAAADHAANDALVKALDVNFARIEERLEVLEAAGRMGR